jgi:hypothetical protein
VVALKGRDSARRRNAQDFYPAPFREWRPFRAMVRSRFANPGLRCAAPWAIEYDPFGVEGRAENASEKQDDLFSWW